MTDAKHEAPADTVTISRAEYEALKSGYPGDPSLLHEAPAEGAGEMDDDDASTYAPSVAGLSDYLWNQAQAADSVEGRCILEMWREAVDALRDRSSAPEAREGEAVAWGRFGPDGSLIDLSRLSWGNYEGLYRHPAAPSADKLREFGQHTNLELRYHYSEEGDNDGWQVHQVNGGVNDREWTLMGSGETPADAIDQALAALSTPDALRGGAK